MIFVLILAAMLLWPIGSPEKLFPQNGFDHRNQSSLNRDSWGAGRRVLEYQFDRADRELSPDRWMEEARRGIMSARAVLAEMFPEVFIDPQTAAQFMEWSEQELENRFTRWLLERFFGAGIDVSSAAVFRETGEAGKSFIYFTGPDGNILYDPGTGDPRVIRPGDEGYDFAENLLSWRAMTHDAAGRELQNYQTAIMEKYPELLMYISPGRKEEFERKLTEAGDLAVLSLKHEFEAILAREERYFTAQRLGDVWSLRKRSEDRAAAEIGAALIEEARQACADGIASIEARIEAARADGVDLALAGNEWLEEYREQFNRGLSAWESAEERFLVRRIEWEQSAEQAFHEGMETWGAVFARFEEERRKWEDEARFLFLEGERFFARASQDLETAIAAARAEFEKDVRLRTGLAFERSGALANIYIISSTAAKEARENIDFLIGWYLKANPGITAIPSDAEAFSQWIDQELPYLLSASEGLEKISLEELSAWSAIYRNYTAKAQESLHALARELYPIADIRDPYEAELLRAEAEVEYWKHRTAMAEAVTAYAEALGAGRMTAAESLEAWEKAKAAYDEALALHGKADDSLRNGGAELSSAMDAFVEASGKMRSAGDELEALRQKQQSLINAMRSTGKEKITEDLDYLYRLLSETQELLGSASEDSPWGMFITLSHALEIQQVEEMRKEILEQLFAGDEENFYSLADLALKADSGDFPEDDLLLGLAERLYDEEKISPEQYDFFKSILLNNSQSRIKNEIATRLAAISLLAENVSSANWYYSVRGTAEAGISGPAIPDMEARLFSDWEKDNLELLKARAELELSALDFIEGKEAGDAAAILALLYTGDEIKRQQDREVLERILELLNTDAPIEDESMLFFLYGGSFIDQQYGQEISEVFLSDYFRREEFSRNLYNTYSGFSELAAVIIREEMEQTFGLIKRLWETLGIETGESIVPAPDLIVNAMADSDNLHASILSLVFLMDDFFYHLPSWLDLNFNMWSESLIEYSLSPSEETLLLVERHTVFINEALLRLQNETIVLPDSYPSDILTDEDYEAALVELLDYYSRERYIKGETARLSSLLGIVREGSVTVEQELDAISARIALFEENYAELVTAYHKAADNFQRSGAAYDALYDEAEQAFKNLKDSRNAFETQDAIRLWAETAYLDANRPIEELVYCREKAGRALDVLLLLESLAADRKVSESGEYKSAYENYLESLSLFTLSMDALHKFEWTIKAEQAENDSFYFAYQSQLLLFGRSFSFGEDYVFSGDKSKWNIKDIITIDDKGFLVFAMNSDKILLGADEERAEMLKEYFTPGKTINGEMNPVSQFELALRELGAAFFDRNFTREEYEQLALARDYMIREIIRNNRDVAEAAGWYNTAETLKRGSNLGDMILDPEWNMRIYEFVAEDAHLIDRAQEASWNSLDEDTKKFMEFYTILTLLDGGGSNSGYFSRVSEYREYDRILKRARDRAEYYRKKTKTFLIGRLFKGQYNISKKARDSVAASWNGINEFINMGYLGFTEALFSLDETLNAYKESSEKFAMLSGQKSDIVSWADIQETLASVDGFSGDAIPLKELWEQISAERGVHYVHEALALLAAAGKNLLEANSGLLSGLWQAEEDKRAIHETNYRELYNAYLTGHAELEDVHAAAVLSFRGSVPSVKKHFENAGTALLENLFRFDELGLSGTEGFSILAMEYSGAISKVWEEKYSAELNIRMNEWDLQRRDIREKLVRWQESAGLILEQGRTAWREGEEKLREAGNLWGKTFEEEYGRISDAWTAACIEGLRDKEAWAAAALESAGQAASAAAIALIGAAAEAGARTMDTRDPLGFMNVPDIREGERILSGLLQRTGTGALAGAFGSIRGSAGTLTPLVRSGLNSGGAWNSASVLTEASALARTVREEFEIRESRKMAFMVMNNANDLYMSLEETIRMANEQFRQQMDDEFIIGGQWRRSATGYIKSVVVHSTLFNSIITERAEVEGYRNFIFYYVRSSALTDEESIRSMNAFQSEALIKSIDAEIKGLRERVFAPDAGEFSVHIGDVPRIKSQPNIGKGRSGVFENYGDGELGRLFTEFYFWALKEQRGIAAVAAPAWDKPFWDSRGSAINAPTIRSTVNVVVSAGAIVGGVAGAVFSGGTSLIGSIALSAALNSVDDFVFSALDISGGYKSLGEAGFEFGKALLSNTVSAVSGAVFNGVQGVSSSFFNSGGISALVAESGFDRVMGKTITSGINTIATGTINSLVASVSYDDRSGFGFSGDFFAQSLRGNIGSAFSGMTGTFTSGLMDLGLEGLTKDFSVRGQKLSALTGGLASEGINYALGNDFTLNILNAGLFLDGNNSAGLVEMRIGRNGISFELGSGGTDVSIGTLFDAAKGLEAWKVNMELLFSKNRDSRTYASRMRTLYSGSDENRAEYENILAGRTVIEERKDVTYTQSIYDEASGKKTIFLGSDALNDGSRFGLNVVFSHESYRDGVNNGEIGQKTEGDNAVTGHIETAIALMATYGMGSISFGMALEALQFTYGTSAMADSILDNYDSSEDYWKLIKEPNGTWKWHDDNNADFDITDLINDPEIQKRYGIETSGLLHNLLSSQVLDGKTFGTISAGRMTADLAKTLGYVAIPMAPAAGREYNGLYFPSPQEIAADQLRNFTIQDTLEKIAYNAAHTITIYDNLGRPVTLHKINDANAIAKKLLQQTSLSLSEIEHMKDFGCNFMAIIAVPQLLTKKTLDAQQITDIWNAAIEKGFLYNTEGKEGFVSNRNAIAALALQSLGISNFGISLDGTSKANFSLVGYRVQVPYRGTGHFVLTGANKSLIYNPATSFTSDQRRWISTVEIFAYGK